MPQFLLYARYANEQIALRLDVKSVNEYLKQMLGAKEEAIDDVGDVGDVDDTVTTKRVKKEKPLMSKIDCKIDFEDKVNNVLNIRDARNELVARTGRESFTMDEIIQEIKRKKPSSQYRFDEPDSLEAPANSEEK